MAIALLAHWFRGRVSEETPSRGAPADGHTLLEHTPLWTVMEAMPAPLLAFDGGGTLLDLNSRAARLFGWQTQQLRGAPLSELFDEPALARLRGVTDVTPPSEPDTVIRTQGRHRDGRALPLSITVQPLHDGDRLCWAAALVDLSAEVRLTETLAESELRFRRTLEALPVGAWLIDRNEHLVSDNSAGRRLWAVPDESVPLRYWKGPLHYADTRRPVDDLDRPEYQARLTGRPVRNERLEMTARDGRERNVLYSATPLNTATGEVLITIEETSELQILRRTVQQTQELFDAFFQSPAGGVVLVRPNGRLHAANPSFCALVGYSEMELRDKRLTELTYPEDRAVERAHLKRLLEGQIDGFQLEKRYLHRDGSARWALLSVSMLREADGQPNYLLHTVQPIDVLKAHQALLEQRERELTALTDHNPDAIGRFDRHLRCVYANPAMKRLVPALGEELGVSLRDLGLPAQAIASWEMVLQLVLADGLPRSFEYVIPHTVRDDQTFLAKVVPEPNALGGIDTVLTISRDITELKAKEAALQRHKEELQASRATIRELAAYHEQVREEERKHIAREIHDELGQRLTALKMETSVAQHHARHHAHTELVAQLGQVGTSIDEMVHLARDVAANLRPSALNLGIAPAVEWLAQQFTRQHRLPCALELPDDELPLDDVRAAIVFRIVQESLTNVARHANARRARVTLQRHGTQHARLTVSDDGCGFDPQASRVRPTYGLLGISERALMLGGTLAIAARPGEGTHLTVEFPLQVHHHDATVSD